MKATGIVRKVDELGRFVLPKEIRKAYELENGDTVEVFVDGENVVIQKYKPINPCIITGEVSEDNVKLFDGKITISQRGLEMLGSELDKLRNTI